MSVDTSKVFKRAEFWDGGDATILDIINVLGRFEEASQFGTRTEFAEVKNYRLEDEAQGATLQRYEMAQRMKVVERIALLQNCPKMPFTNAPLAASVGKSVDEFNAMKVVVEDLKNKNQSLQQELQMFRNQGQPKEKMGMTARRAFGTLPKYSGKVAEVDNWKFQIEQFLSEEPQFSILLQYVEDNMTEKMEDKDVASMCSGLGCAEVELQWLNHQLYQPLFLLMMLLVVLEVLMVMLQLMQVGELFHILIYGQMVKPQLQPLVY